MRKFEEYFKLYFNHNFIPLLLKGYHQDHNTELDQDKAYRLAKTPISTGFTKTDYEPPRLGDCRIWVKDGGWIGWLVPANTIIIDSENRSALDFIDDRCNELGIQPPINNTNYGRQFVFTCSDNIAGSSEAFTKSGVPVTYRAAGSNYVILPPINGRSWDNLNVRQNPPILPEEFKPYDRKNVMDVLNCLSWQVREAYRYKLLAGWDDIDSAFLAFLISLKFPDEKIFSAFRLIFSQDYDQKRTETMIQRTKEMFEKGQTVIGTGSFVQRIKENNLKKIERFVNELHSLTMTSVESGSWPDPIPFDDYSNLPDFPVNALPSIGRDFVVVLSEVAQADFGLAGAGYLAVLSTCLGGKVKVNLVSHIEPVNLFIGAILPSGGRKSSVFSKITLPIYEFQKMQQEHMSEMIRDAVTENKILESRLLKLEKIAASENKLNKQVRLQMECKTLSDEISNHPIPTLPVFICDDITTEALGSLMAENNDRMAIISAEGGILKLMGGLYSGKDKNGNFDLYLKSHAADPWSSHRVGRKPETMNAPALTMGLAIQPDVIEELGRNREFRGRGLVARFLYVRCSSKVGYRNRQTKSLSAGLIKKYHDHIYELMDISAGIELRLTAEAQLVWDALYNEIEMEMRPGGRLEHMQDWGSKLAGAVARSAGLLHFANHGSAGIDKPISVDIVDGSCQLGRYFMEHAISVFGLMKEDHRIATAKKILAYIKRDKPEKFKGRDILHHAYFQSRTMEDIQPGLAVLRERGFIREVTAQYTGKGRPEATIYEVNPKIFTFEKPATKSTKMLSRKKIEI